MKLHYLAEYLQISVLDVTPVFAEMDDDSLGTSLFHNASGGHRVRLIRPAGLPHRGHMVNVYT
jgi:hypothetical protein